MNTTLKDYIEKNSHVIETSPYYSETFCNLTLDYYGQMGEFSESDMEYLNSLGYSQADFMDDEEVEELMFF